MIFCCSSQHQCQGYPLYILVLHTSQWSFCPQTFLENTRSNLLQWNPLLSGLLSQLAYEILWRGFRLDDWLPLRCLPPVCRYSFLTNTILISWSVNFIE